MPGEIVTLLGANGAGKTTFLHTVIGLVTTTSGRVLSTATTSRAAPPEDRVNGGIALCARGPAIFAS